MSEASRRREKNKDKDKDKDAGNDRGDDGIPAAPAFCKRLTPEEARRVSEESTRRELEKLSGAGVAGAGAGGVHQTWGRVVGRSTATALPASGGSQTADMHDMLMKYAEKYGNCCDQLCRIAGELRDSQAQLLSMKDELHERQSQKEHFQGMAEQYEEDDRQLRADMEHVRGELCRQRSKSSISIPVLLLLCVYTLFIFEMQRLYSVVDTYADYRNFLS